MGVLVGTDPRTGQPVGPPVPRTGPDELAVVLDAAQRAAAGFAGTGPDRRVELLQELADAVEAERDRLVALAVRETGLPQPRLIGEVTRTSFQLRLFADVVRDGGYLEATVDTPTRARCRAAPRPAPDAGAARARPGVRGQQLPVRVQRAGRRHRLGAGRRLPGGGQGAPRPPGAVARGRPSWPPAVRRAPGCRRACSAVVTATRPGVRAGRSTRASRPPGSPARPRAAGRCSTSPPPGPTRSRSTASWAASTRSWSRRRAVARARRGDRDGLRRLVHPRRRAVLHQAGPAVPARRRTAWTQRCADAVGRGRGRPDAHRAHPRTLRRRRWRGWRRRAGVRRCATPAATAPAAGSGRRRCCSAPTAADVRWPTRPAAARSASGRPRSSSSTTAPTSCPPRWTRSAAR